MLSYLVPSKMKSKGEELQLWENSQYIPLTPTQDERSAKSYTLKLPVSCGKTQDSISGEYGHRLGYEGHGESNC